MFNQSRDFLLIEFHYSRYLQIFFSFLLLLSYLATLTGNSLVVVLSWKEQRLHSPMYFFLSNLSILEICVTSTITPKFFSVLATKDRSISFLSCMTQSYLYFSLASVDFFLLAIMSFDRYMAICHPLHYMNVMNSRVCINLAIGCWLGGFLDTIFSTVLVSYVSFCGSNTINHFFCDAELILKLVCTDISLINLVNILASSVTVLGSFACITVSYTFIIIAIVKLPTDGQRWKTISTCSSHLILVSMFCAGSLLMWLRFLKVSSIDFSKVAVTLNTIIAPLLNPFIYTLRNSHVKSALKEFIGRS